MALDFGKPYAVQPAVRVRRIAVALFSPFLWQFPIDDLA
jgi:hypothetical protein